MKTRRRHPMTATVFTLAALLVLNTVALNGAAVVCVGADGSVDVESSICTCCSVPDSLDARALSGFAPTDSSCSDCVDVPLNAPLFRSKDTRLSMSRCSEENRTHALVRNGGGDETRLILPCLADLQGHSLALLSTVVLLT